MSRIGLDPIKIKEGVEVNINGNDITVKGKLGELSMKLDDNLNYEMVDGVLNVTRKNELLPTKALHGTYRMLIANMIEGVSEGYTKKLEIMGVGYRVKMQGKDLSFSLGYNHPVVYVVPEGITAEVPDEVTVIIKGIDKQKVGQVAAKIRSLKKPEPYKGKGIKYDYEVVRRKSAKSAAATK